MDGARLLRRLAVGAAGAAALVVARPSTAHAPTAADRPSRTGRDEGTAAAEAVDRRRPASRGADAAGREEGQSSP